MPAARQSKRSRTPATEVKADNNIAKPNADTIKEEPGDEIIGEEEKPVLKKGRATTKKVQSKAQSKKTKEQSEQVEQIDSSENVPSDNNKRKLFNPLPEVIEDNVADGKKIKIDIKIDNKKSKSTKKIVKKTTEIIEDDGEAPAGKETEPKRVLRKRVLEVKYSETSFVEAQPKAGPSKKRSKKNEDKKSSTQLETIDNGNVVVDDNDDVVGEKEEKIDKITTTTKKKSSQKVKITKKTVSKEIAQEAPEENGKFSEEKPSNKELENKRKKINKSNDEQIDANVAVEKNGKIVTDEPELPQIVDNKPNQEFVNNRRKIKNKSDKKSNADNGNVIDDGGKEIDAENVVAEKKKTLLNKTDTIFSKIDFNVQEKGKEYNFKISSWNVAGLRALAGKGGMEYIEHEQPDIFCFQEIKCIADDIPTNAQFKGYHPYYCTKPGGRGGVAMYSKIMPYNIEYGIGDDDLDSEGRIITAEFSKFYLICVYVPNAGRKLVTLPKRLKWNKLFAEHVQKLDKLKPVIICGDMNVSHNEIDLANPKSNTNNAGFTREERDGMTEFLNLGFIDTFRDLYPDKVGYSYWTYMANARSRNVGWRLDYFLISERFKNKVVDNVMRSDVLGSDHCPIVLFLNV